MNASPLLEVIGEQVIPFFIESVSSWKVISLAPEALELAVGAEVQH